MSTALHDCKTYNDFRSLPTSWLQIEEASLFINVVDNQASVSPEVRAKGYRLFSINRYSPSRTELL
jgi:hypothetical protein